MSRNSNCKLARRFFAKMVTAGVGARRVRKTVIWPVLPEDEIVELPNA